MVLLHPFFEVGISEQVGQEVRHEVREEVSIVRGRKFREVAEFEVDLLADQHSVEQDKVTTGLGEGHLVEVLTLLHSPTRDVLGNCTEELGTVFESCQVFEVNFRQ